MKTSTVKNTYSIKSINFRGIFAAFAFLICFLAAQNASAANYVVTRIDDRNNATCVAGNCSLREAIKTANATTVADTITFNIPAASCNASTNVCTITLTTASGGEIVINSAGGALTINGTGANRLTINGGAGTNRIFYSNAATFNLSGVTLTGGNGAGATFSGIGGAIFVNGGTTNISGVYFNANSAASGSGGGILFLNGTNHRVENSTFSGNTTRDDGGGIFVQDASLTVINTTLTGNSTNGVGGGITAALSGTLTLRGVTITANTARLGGGVYRDTGTLDFGNTIIAGNTGTSGFPEIYFFSGTATSRGYNLVGDSAGDASATSTAITYQSTDILDTPPLLDPLADYGGTTPTRRLQTGSPAIDKGNSFGLTTDQRGLLRPVDFATYPNATGGNGADIGAVELQNAPTAASVTIGGRVMTESGRGIRNVWITLTDSSGNVRTATTTAFGYYRFADVAAGETYIITAFGKRYTFSQPSQVLNINGDLTDINFVGHSNFFSKQEK